MATPPQRVGAFLGYAVVLAVAARVARIPLARLARGLLIEIPFVIFALALPFIGLGPRVEVGPLSLSESGLWSAWGILAKASLTVTAATLLAATTRAEDIVLGLQTLRLPAALTSILTFFVRYVDVVADQFVRMRMAQRARGLTLGPRSWPTLAHSLATLFVRAFERGERVHLALLSRGYTGRLPAVVMANPVAPGWAFVVPAAAGLVWLVALWMQ